MQILKILESFLIYIAPYHTRQSKYLCSIYNKINDFYEKNILLIEARTCTYVVLWSEHFAVFGHIIDSDAFFRGLNKSSDLAKCLLISTLIWSNRQFFCKRVILKFNHSYLDPSLHN